MLAAHIFAYICKSVTIKDVMLHMQVWGLSSSTLLYQSTIVSSSPFLKLAMHPTHQSFAVGSDDGMVSNYSHYLINYLALYAQNDTASITLKSNQT